MATISQQECEALCLSIFTQNGLSAANAKTCYDHLIYNELSGKTSHGLVRVKWIADGLKSDGLPTAPPEIELDNQSISIINGQNNIGLIAASYGTDIAIAKARAHGIAFTGINNYHTTTGTMNYYNRRILDAGLIGIIGCNSYAMVAHPQGHDPVIGTNPISFAIPARATTFLADVTTANISYGKIMIMKRAKNNGGENIPLGMLIDAQGAPSQNPDDTKKGAMLPMSGYKGFGLGLAIELLAGPLIGAKGGKNAVNGSDGLFIITIDPEKFGHSIEITNNIEQVLQEIKTSRHAPEINEILIPGERSEQTYAQQKGQETITIIDEIYHELQELAKA